MNKTALILSILVAALLNSGCVTNNGDIGQWYGTWALDEVTVDGVADNTWRADDTWTTWSFQNNIICIQRVNALEDVTNAWGTWSESDGKLLLDYTHHDEGQPNEVSSYYRAPTWIYFTLNAVNALTIEHNTGRTVTLAMTDAEGRRLVYSLRKTY